MAAPSSIIKTVFDAAVVKVNAMTTAGGYNFNWGDTNVFDRAHIDNVSYGASCWFDWQGEETQDPVDQAHANAYRHIVSFFVHILVVTPSELSNPKIGALPYLWGALDDLKEVFRDADVGGYYLRYERSSKEDNVSGDIFMPLKLVSEWTFDYTQDRETPTQAGDV